MILKKLKFAIVLAAVLLANCGYAKAEESVVDWLLNFKHTNGVRPVTNKTYREECGSCHFAYQPGLLPTKSWEKLLTPKALHDHFGEVADLDQETLQLIHDYAILHAADKSYYKISRKIAVAAEGVEAPVRITDVRYFKRKHHNIPEKMVKDNKDVKSLSYCSSCHTQAENGVYDPDTVSIPNFPSY